MSSEKEADEALQSFMTEELDMLQFQILGENNFDTNLVTNANSTDGENEAEESSRFQKVSWNDVETFFLNQQNVNTKRKTDKDMLVFKQYLQQSGELRVPEIIPPYELNLLLSTFFLSVKEKDGTEYEPSTLRSYLSSIDRYMKMKSYPVSIVNAIQFSKCRAILKLKQKELKGMGKGNKPKATDEITDAELEKNYETKTMGGYSPSSLVYSLWLVCTTNFGMSPGKEIHDLKWGDVELRKDVENDKEYLIYTQERQTKTRTGANARDVRQVKPRAYANEEDPHKDPVWLYKLYSSKRPVEMNNPDSAFFLTINKDASLYESKSKWYKKCPMGINKLYGIMKEIKEKSGLETDRRLTNYSARKRLVQKLSDSGVPPNQICQITGHKNVNSLNNYSKLNPNQSMNISRILTSGQRKAGNEIDTVNLTPPATNIPAALGKPTDPNSNSSLGSLFGGNTAFNGTVNFHFHGSQTQHMQASSQYVISSEHVSPQASSSPKKFKRIRINDSDSD